MRPRVRLLLPCALCVSAPKAVTLLLAPLLARRLRSAALGAVRE